MSERALGLATPDPTERLADLIFALGRRARAPAIRQHGRVAAPGGSGETSDILMTPETRYARSGDVNIAYQVVGEAPPDLALVHKSGRLVKEEIFPVHDLAFPEGCIHAENVGGDIEKALTTRCIIGAFPWNFEGDETCPCRIIAFFDVGPLTVEEVREAMGKKPA